MSRNVRISIATIFALGACLVATSSSATNTREAIKACDANPKCQFDVKADGVVISVNGELIICPVKNGPCGVAHMTGHARPNTDAATQFQLVQ